MTTINNIIDIIGDTIFTPTITSNNRSRLEQVIYDNKSTAFDDILYNEKKKYENKYNLKRDHLKQALVNKKLLKIKISENNQLIDALIRDIKNMSYKPTDYDVDDELSQLLND